MVSTRFLSFVSSQQVMRLLSVSRNLKARPSELFGIEDPYTAYCLDEACSYIISRIEQGEEPRFKKEYKSFKDIYRQYGL